MSLHKLTAGSGYEYLTRQVAAHDATQLGQPDLAGYYTAKGERPGIWVGSGIAGIEGLSIGDEVTAQAMRNLFGNGWHPLAEQLRETAREAGLDVAAQDRAAWLGRPYRVYEGDVPLVRRLVAQRAGEVNTAAGRPAGAALSDEELAKIRTSVAVDLFRDEFGRDPLDAREIASVIARHSRPRTNAVSGFDLTFSPVKSVSALWAIADPALAARIERAHDAAVTQALSFIETRALFTREGVNGARQVETRGLVAAAFTHRDSRAGDPDLHTHVAVANKVQTRDGGRWLAIDARVLYKAAVCASEVYNTSLETHLREDIGLSFTPVPGTDPRKRPIREVTGLDRRLVRRWSSRREAIQARRAVLARAFQDTHGRPPTPIEAIGLAQQATLETRDAKHEPRSLAVQRAAWAREAAEALGSGAAVTGMVTAVLHPGSPDRVRVDAAWVAAAAERVVTAVAGSRATWQSWHVEAEAWRQARTAGLNSSDTTHLVGLLVDAAVTGHCLPLTDRRDLLDPPVALRRSTGESLYTPVGGQVFTSRAVLEAEARILARAGQHDAARAPIDAVHQALRESAAAGTALNPGQAMLVTEMATSGARVQLAIAPAGAGKTTAMRALTRAWTLAGGTVIGLAPSAAAAAVLQEATGAASDTLAKLAWHLTHPTLAPAPAWAQRLGPGALVVIDEAGMADTLTLDTVIEHVTAAGGSVRLVGDDQQLAAIGAGGILRDIHTTHGAIHLSELMRFTDPAEAAASLALRDGLPEAIGFYLDAGRVHPADPDTLTATVYAAWARDHANGLDALMLAPTREAVTELNALARAHRLTSAGQSTRVVGLADGNQASVGDTVITRANARRLRVSATDWVKNGDRWTITNVHDDQSLTVQHIRTGLSAHLPAGYVSEAVELGYACTIHAAQGVTSTTCHTILQGTESRQVAYTALTRARHANHVYLPVTTDGEAHTLIHPHTIRPRTASDVLEAILARDETARSATTTAREAAHPATLLADAVTHYTDSLTAALTHLLPPRVFERLDTHAGQVVPGLPDTDGWATLRAGLLHHAATTGTDPAALLEHLAAASDLDDAGNAAAVLAYRLHTLTPTTSMGPLPWLPGIPDLVGHDATWGPYLAGRAAHVRHLVAALSDLTRADLTAGHAPAWARDTHAHPGEDLACQITVWRAATGVPDSDRRLLGPTHPDPAGRAWQHHLATRAAHTNPALDEWAPLLTASLTHPARDPFLPVLAERLAATSRAGIDTPNLLHTALTAGPLPDEHQAAALWWRITTRLSPAVAAAIEGPTLETDWTGELPALLGEELAATVRASAWWPALVAAIEHATARGNPLPALFSPATVQAITSDGIDVDPCQALLWRTTLLTTHPDDPDREDQPTSAPEETNPFWDDETDPAHLPDASSDAAWAVLTPLEAPTEPDPDTAGIHDPGEEDLSDERVDAVLALAALTRAHAGVQPFSDRQVEIDLAHAWEAETSPVSPERIADLTEAATCYYQERFTTSWARPYLQGRLAGTDLDGHPGIRPGYAPLGWTALTTHLQRVCQASDDELITAGLSTRASTGGVIDRFRDRLILPITAPDGTVLGFTARRNPAHETDPHCGPKYLNTPDTPLFHKSDQLYIPGHAHLQGGATPVLVEGPLDAVAITLTTPGTHTGVAALGTALTEPQARALAVHAHTHHVPVVIATDNDPAGNTAARRHYWRLAPHNIPITSADLPAGTDPADLLTHHGPMALHATLAGATPLAERLLAERLDTPTRVLATLRETTLILATDSPATWADGITLIADRTGLPENAIRRHLAHALGAWNTNPHTIADTQSRWARPATDTRPAPKPTASITRTQPKQPHAAHDVTPAPAPPR